MFKPARASSGCAAAAVVVFAAWWIAGCDRRPSAKTAAPATRAAASGAPAGLVEIPFKSAKKLIIGTPKDIKIDGPLEPFTDKPRPAFYAPTGTVNLAHKQPVTSSDSQPIIGGLDLITDGDREGTDGSFVELGPGVQWVQIDLSKAAEIWHVLIWQYHAGPRVYKDVVVQVSDDANFIDGVKTVFNNDHDGSAGLGIGADKMYFESHEGKLIQTRGQVKGRYVRCHSKGSTSDEQNHFIEVEVYGLPVK